MTKKHAGMIAVVIGIGVVVVGAAADAVGLGRSPGFGLLQAAAVAGGIILAGLGVWLLRRES